MVRIFWKVLQSAPPPPKVWREYLLNENNEYYFTLIAMFGNSNVWYVAMDKIYELYQH
jgi:hypothetical protein